ncbi:hypothetical protein TPA0906_44580 [Streptomyces olivaceus]|uniref:helix-turn-helix domain-containing protein n=1 Tax=Streptomyces olivaceus TaxID=47716 RepID=UPI0022EDEBA3|nr:helix-turn-helix transcriptional regulator [Streptomyces olivaceus]GHJ02593.1 hypothetical protein TPA0906_44580 [Streptomyces olivaceus]
MVGQPQARVVQALARALQARLDEQGLTLRQAAALTGVNRQAIANLLAGVNWPDVITISRIEDGLGVALWPGGTVPASVAAG